MAFNLITSVPPTATSGGASGPLADLNQPGFTYSLYSYPSVQNPSFSTMSHNIIFYINIPQQSYWNNPNPAAGTPPAPTANRIGAASNFGLRTVGQTTLGTPGQELGTGNLYNAIQNLVLQSGSTRTSTAIGLYIPPTMIYTQTMQYENVALSDALGPLADVASAVSLFGNGKGKDGFAALSNIIPDAVNAIGGPLRHFGDFNTARDAVLKGVGVADNPQNFLLFKQIDFRKFSFDFILTPENQNETQVINQIIKLFRFHSAPEVLAGSLGRFFVPPSEFDIDILHNGDTNINIPQINTCVCTGVSVNYAQAGQWVTYSDGQPVQTKLSLQFTETQILTKDLVNAGF